MPPYDASFPKGTKAKIADEPILRHFQQTWKLHNPLQLEQIACAGKSGLVKAVGYYHGGDVLYQLEGLPGVWHESCLTKPSS